MANKYIYLFQIFMLLVPAWVVAIGIYALGESLMENASAFLIVSSSALAVAGMLGVAFGQKTVFNYTVNADGGECESYLDFPDWIPYLFKGVGICVVLFCLVVAIVSWSFIPLIGAGALGLGYAVRLLRWEGRKDHEQGDAWCNYRFITLDCKRNMIVAHWDDITFGFEIRCGTQASLESCLGYLEHLLNPSVEFLKRDWDANEIYSLNK